MGQHQMRLIENHRATADAVWSGPMLASLPFPTMITLAVAILLLATLYSSVGHAGASGYLAAMALVTQLPQEEMKLIALTLNIFVGAIGSWRFHKAGHFHWGTFWPFALCAIPMAFIGGFWKLPPLVFKPLIGAVLAFAAVMLIIKAVGSMSEKHRRNPGPGDVNSSHMPPLPISLLAGGILGLLAGLTGTGGGIFLSPLLILCGWAGSKRTAAVSIVFVLVNSLAGLTGVIAESPGFPPDLPWYVIAAILGGLVGSWLGARQLKGDGIRMLLAIVLLIAAVKMILPVFELMTPESTGTVPMEHATGMPAIN